MQAGMEEIDKLKSELEEVRAVMMKKDEELRDTQAKLSTAQNQHKTTVKDLELEVLAVSRGLQASDSEKEAAEKKIQEVEAQLEAEKVRWTKEYNELVTEMDMLKTTVSQLTTDKEGSRDLQAKCSSLTDNMKKLQDQLRRRSVELHGDMSAVQTDLLACKQELARVKKEREKLQNQLDGSKNDSFQLNSKNILLANELGEVKEKLCTVIDKHQESEAMVAEQADKLSAQETELLEVRSRKDTLDRELQGLRELIQKSEQQSSVMEATVYQLRKELNEDKTSEKKDEELQQLKDELDASIKKNQTLQGELDEKQETQESLRAQLKEQLEMVEKLSTANSLKSDGVRELEKEVKIKGDEVKELKDEVANLQKELDEASQKCQKFSNLETRIIDMDKKCDEQSELYDKATDKIIQLTNDNLKLREKMAAISKQAELKVEALTEDVASKEKKAESLRVILEARQSEWERKDNSHESVKLKAEGMEKENCQLHEELSALSTKLADLEGKLKDQASDSQANEKRLACQLTAMEEKAAALSDELKATNEKLATAEERRNSPTDEHEQISALKAAINEQEKTMKMQDEVVEEKEEQISALNKEICEWRLKCQDLCDADLEKISLKSKLTSADNEKKFMQEMQAKMMSQVSMLNEKTTKLTAENDQLKEEKQKLEDRVKSAADDGVMEKEQELQALRQEMEEWQANKQVLVEELRQVLVEKDETIKKLQSGDEAPSSQVEELEKKLAKKEKTILLLENKIQRQESTIQDLVGGSTRTTRGRAGSSASSMADEREKLQSLQAELDEERRNHEKAQEALERIHFARDEQVKDLKQANQKLQKEINQLNKRVSTRVSERFKEPSFTNDDELSQSTLELDVTPMSAKKRQRVSRSSRRTSTRQDTSVQKENISTSRTSTLKRRLQGLVEKSTSPLASPVLTKRGAVEDAKKLLQVRATPLKESKTSSPDTPAGQQAKPATRGRRNLYTVGEQVLCDTPGQESTSSRRSTRSNANIHTNVLRSMRSSRLK